MTATDSRAPASDTPSPSDAPMGQDTDSAPDPTVVFPDNPVLAVFTRGGIIESFHRGAAIVLDAQGVVRLAWGDVERPIFARSALKPLQALPLLERGAESPLLTDARAVLHSASHSGCPVHTTRLAAWLADMGLSVDDLACGDADWPMDPEAARALAARGEKPTRLHHNCSGQHTGFLMLAGLLDVPVKGYESPDHPVQRSVTRTLSEMMDLDMESLSWGVEGCGVPSPALPLWAVALGMARLADPSGQPATRVAAATRLRRSIAGYPELLAGPGRCDTRMAEVTGGRVITKIGAEGVVAAMLPEAGLGLALKIDDGTPRGAELALGAVLDSLDVLSDSERNALAPLFQPVVTNAAGVPVGQGLPVQPADTDPGDVEDLDPWDWDEDDSH